MAYALAIAFVLVAVAELGDKTQLLTLVLAARYRPIHVLAGVAGAVLVLQFAATAVGSAVGNLLPRTLLGVFTGVLFVGFGLWTLRPQRDEDAEGEASRASRFGPVAGVAIAFFLAEIGDKTQVLTMTIAADPGAAARSVSLVGLDVPAPSAGPAAFLGVWLGSALGMLLVNGLAIVVGAALGSRLPEKWVRVASGVVFILFGVAALASTFLG